MGFRVFGFGVQGSRFKVQGLDGSACTEGSHQRKQNWGAQGGRGAGGVRLVPIPGQKRGPACGEIQPILRPGF